MSSYCSIHTQKKKYCELFDQDELKQVEEQVGALKIVYRKFLDSYSLDDSSVRLDEEILTIAILDYFVDIQRLKGLHDSITFVNEDKIIAYESAWILKRKPVQLLRPDLNLVHINEKFVAEIIIDHLVGDFPDAYKYDELKEFCQHLIYHLIYRSSSPKTLELMIVAFKTARQVFETKNKESKEKRSDC